MPVKDYLRSLLAELAGFLRFDRRRKDKTAPETPPTGISPPDKRDPEEVQYPGYFEGKGRL